MQKLYKMFYAYIQTAADEFKAQLNDEFHLTEVCLRENPKSYGAWHHRGWVLNLMTDKVGNAICFRVLLFKGVL